MKNKLSDNHNHHYDFQNNIYEFVEIIAFIYGKKKTKESLLIFLLPQNNIAKNVLS